MGTRVRATRVEVGQHVRYWMDEDCWAELPQLDSQVDERLSGADGWASAEKLRRGLAPGQAEQLEAIFQLFASHGLAVRGRPESTLASLRAAVVGQGPLARGIAAGLLRGGVRELVCLDAGASGKDPAPPPGTLARGLRPRLGARVRTAATVLELARAGVELVLVALPTREPDRMLLAELVRHGLPHLVVGCHEDQSRLGPLVLPGRSACVLCHDLARTALDPGWPLVLAQLTRTASRPHPTLLGAITSRTVLEAGWCAQNMAWASRLCGRVELQDLQHPGQRELSFQLHPECGCCWQP